MVLTLGIKQFKWWALIEDAGGRARKAGRWYQKIGAQVNLDQIDPENDDGEIRFSIWAAKKCAQAF